MGNFSEAEAKILGGLFFDRDRNECSGVCALESSLLLQQGSAEGGRAKELQRGRMGVRGSGLLVLRPGDAIVWDTETFEKAAVVLDVFGEGHGLRLVLNFVPARRECLDKLELLQRWDRVEWSVHYGWRSQKHIFSEAVGM